MSINYRNLSFTVVLAGILFFLWMKGFLIPFIMSDTSLISLSLLVTFTIVSVRYIIDPIDQNSFVYLFTQYYEKIIAHMGLLGTMIGFYVAIRSIDGMDLNAANVQKIIENMMSGFYIALVSTIVSTSISVIIYTYRAMGKK